MLVNWRGKDSNWHPKPLMKLMVEKSMGEIFTENDLFHIMCIMYL